MLLKHIKSITDGDITCQKFGSGSRTFSFTKVHGESKDDVRLHIGYSRIEALVAVDHFCFLISLLAS